MFLFRYVFLCIAFSLNGVVVAFPVSMGSARSVSMSTSVENRIDQHFHAVAEAIANGRPVPQWRYDSRGIVSTYVEESIYQNPHLICSLLYHGFEPGGGSIDMYIANCVIEPPKVKVQRRSLKRLAREDGHLFHLRIDSAWEKVVKSVQGHTERCWLSDELASFIWSARQSEAARKLGTSFHCVELWLGDELVAANIGYTVGHIYSGFTKFYKKSDDTRGCEKWP
eukprot:TRINITY_DN32042_c0_g1_i3.p1 TRINITY_DN32042_c0_g1~~TRINITY_DN32042_c0_g1_i3.p1  ORF type:complete len:225 (-),score=9.57 TRINITY_DN32042_c0_g1_i3:53-727(-)